MRLNIIKLAMDEPVALSARRVDAYLEHVLTLPSDLLKAAILSAYSSLPDINQEDIEALHANLILSSAFPWSKNSGVNRELLFFPVPQMRLPINETRNQTSPPRPGLIKDIKKVKFAGQSIFEKMINGKYFEFDRQCFLHDGTFIIEPPGNRAKEDEGNNCPSITLYASETLGRVSLGCKPMLGYAQPGDPYFFSRTYFNDRCGYWFAWTTGNDKQDEVKDALQIALDLLKDEGIGADRNVGNGRFCFDMDSIELEVPSNPDGYLLLSRWIPEKEEISLFKQGTYRLSKRDGYMAGASAPQYRHYFRKSIWMIEEGAVFRSAQPPVGKVVDVTPDNIPLPHPIYRDGRAFTIPVVSKTDDHELADSV